MKRTTLAASVILGMLEEPVTPIMTTAALPLVFMVSLIENYSINAIDNQLN